MCYINKILEKFDLIFFFLSSLTKIYVFCKKVFKIFDSLLFFTLFLSLLANIDVFCMKIFKKYLPGGLISEDSDPFLHFQASWQSLYVLGLGNFSNLSFLTGAEQLICRTHLTASVIATSQG